MTNIQQYLNKDKNTCVALPRKVSKCLQVDNFLSEYDTDEERKLVMNNILLFDKVPTKDSKRLVNSGDLYDYLQTLSRSNLIVNIEDYNCPANKKLIQEYKTITISNGTNSYSYNTIVLTEVDIIYHNVTFNVEHGIFDNNLTEITIPVAHNERVSINVTPNQHYKMPSNIDGATFVKNSNGGYEVIVSNVTEDITINIVCDPKIKYTIHFDSKGGSHIEDRQVEEGESINLNEIIPTNSDNTKRFKGWYFNDNYTNKCNSSYTPTGEHTEITLYAKWETIDLIWFIGSENELNSSEISNHIRTHNGTEFNLGEEIEHTFDTSYCYVLLSNGHTISRVTSSYKIDYTNAFKQQNDIDSYKIYMYKRVIVTNLTLKFEIE